MDDSLICDQEEGPHAAVSVEAAALEAESSFLLEGFQHHLACLLPTVIK